MPGFGSLTLIALSLLAVLAAGHFALFGRREWGRVQPGPERLGPWGRLLHLGLGAGFLGLAATGFFPALAGGERLGGYLLLLHFLGAGLFLPCLALSALAWVVPEKGREDRLSRGLFWAGLGLGWSAGLSMLLAMTPAFTPEEIELLGEVHRFSALGLLLVVLTHTYLTAIVRPERLRLLWAGRPNSRRAVPDRPDATEEREEIR